MRRLPACSEYPRTRCHTSIETIDEKVPRMMFAQQTGLALDLPALAMGVAA